jgi:two-component system, LytTR family, sensor kinase
MEIPGLRSQPFFDDKNRAFWLLQSLGWSFYLLLRVASSAGAGMSISFLIPLLVSTATGYSITLVMGGVYRWLITRRPIVTWSVSVVTYIAALTTFSLVDSWVFNLLDREGGGFNGALFLSALSINALLLAAWSALYYGINFYLIVERQADQLLVLETQATSAQLAMLRYQLNPHFLFNTLNSISTLVLLKQTERANAMLSRLSSFLRYTLANEATAQVTLEQEIETLKLYLEIEKMRFEERLRPVFEIEPAAERARLPSLLLQPLVENAIKYAVTPQEEGAEIAVTARLAGDRVQVTVSDTGGGLSEGGTTATDSTGVGLANIRDRLAQAYGGDHRFETRTVKGKGFTVLIDIPFQTETPQLEAA